MTACTAALVATALISGAAPPQPCLDVEGVPLPAGVMARVGSARFRHDYPAGKAAWSADGKQFAVGDVWGGLRVWGFPDGRTLLHLTRERAGGRVHALVFTAGGRTLLAGILPDSGKPALFRVDLRTGATASKPLALAGSIFMHWAFSEDGRRVAADEGRSVHVFDTATGKKRRTFTLKGNVEGLAAGAAMRRLFASTDKEAFLLDVEADKASLLTGKLFYPKAGVAHRSPLMAVHRRDDDGERPVIDVVSWADGKARQNFSFPEKDAPSPTALLFTPDDGAVIVCCGEAHTLARYDLKAKRWAWRTSTWPVQPERPSVSPDGKTLALVGVGPSPVFLDAATGKPHALTPPPTGHFRPEGFLNGGRELLVSHAGLEAYDARTGRLLRRLASVPVEGKFVPWAWGVVPRHPDEYGWYLHRTFSADGRRAFAFGGMKARAGDARTGKAGKSFGLPVLKWQRAACTHDGERLLADAYIRGAAPAVEVFDAHTGKCLRSLGESSTEKQYIVPCTGRRLALTGVELFARSGSGPPNPSVSLWDIDTGRRLGSFTPEGKPFTRRRPAVSPNGEVVAVPSYIADSKGRQIDTSLLQFWDTASGRQWPAARWRAPARLVSALAFTPDGRMAAVGLEDGGLLLWEVATGRVRRELRHGSQVTDLLFSPDGRALAAASDDAPLYLWDVYGPAAPLREADAEAVWRGLQDADAARAFAAVGRLVRSPGVAVRFLKGRLSVPAPDERRIKRLIAGLDSDDFTAREKATEQLLREEESADALLRRAFETADSAEVKKRLRLIVARPVALSPGRLRLLRAIEALEAVGTAEARALLKPLAGGPKGDRLSEAALAALGRLRRR